MTERGQSLVELAVSLTVLLFLLSGAVEFGIAFFQFVQLRDAAQEGALYGSMDPRNEPGIMARVRNASSSPIDLSDGTLVSVAVSVHDPAGNIKGLAQACEGDGMTVGLMYYHHIFMPFLPRLIGRDTLPLHAVVTDTILTPACP